MTEKQDEANAEKEKKDGLPNTNSTKNKANNEASKETKPTSDKTKNNTQPQIKNLWKNESTVSKINALATVSLAFFTFALFCVTTWLVYDGHRQLANAENQTAIFRHTDSVNSINITKSLIRSDSALALTKKAVIISDSSLKLTQKNFTIENRPYLFIKEITPSKLEDGKAIRFEATVYNVGKMPALHIHTFAHIRSNKTPYYKFFVDEVANSISPSLPPSANVGITATSLQIPNQENIENINKNKNFIYFYGKVSYTDTLGGIYYTRFCVMYDPNSPKHVTYNSTFNDIR